MSNYIATNQITLKKQTNKTLEEKLTKEETDNPNKPARSREIEFMIYF